MLIFIIFFRSNITEKRKVKLALGSMTKNNFISQKKTLQIHPRLKFNIWQHFAYKCVCACGSIANNFTTLLKNAGFSKRLEHFCHLCWYYSVG